MWWMFVCTFIQRFWIAVAKCKSIQQYLKVLEIVSVPHTCTHTLNAHKYTSQMYGQCDDSAYVWNTSSTSFRISRHLDSTFHKILHKHHTHKKKNEWPYLNIHIGFIFFLNLNFAFCLRDFFCVVKSTFHEFGCAFSSPEVDAILFRLWDIRVWACI